MSVAASGLFALHKREVLRDVDMAFAKLLQRLGGSEEVMLAGALAMLAVTEGHSGFTLDQASDWLQQPDFSFTLPDTVAWSEALKVSPLVGSDSTQATPLTFEYGRVALRRYAHYEADLVTRLLAKVQDNSILQFDSDRIQNTLSQLFKLQTGTLDLQALAAWTALHQWLTLVTGGPGTGKTTTVARILALLVEHSRSPLKIALAAPTGRAAARLGEAINASLGKDIAEQRINVAVADKIPRQAQTLHRLLGWRSSSVDFKHHENAPLPFDVVVVDEASMIDLPLMAKLVAAVAPQARLILLGDPDQLPAVEAGNVLGALCVAAGSGTGLSAIRAQRASMALQAAVPVIEESLPLSGHRIQLQHSYRQASAIRLLQLADAVREGDTKAAMQHLAVQDQQLQWQQGNVLALGNYFQHHLLEKYRALAFANHPTAALEQASGQRVLCAVRHGPFGAITCNQWFARQLNLHHDAWFHGRLIMITANHYGHGLFNGDTGIAWLNDENELVVWFEQGGVLRAWRPGQLPAHETAFASTVHKAQGSEFDHVSLILPEMDTRASNRELLYTGLTRARQSVCIWGAQDIVGAAIARRSLRDSGLNHRFSAV